MAIDKFDIDTIPTLVKTLDTDETVVTVTVYDRVARSPIALSADAATQFPAGSGSWYWDVAFTTRPSNGINQYEAFMIGTTYGQRRRILFDWNEDADKYKGAVYLDTTGAGTAGQGRYVGTDFRPSSNLADAIAISARLNTKILYLKGNLALDQTISDYNISAWRGYSLDSLSLNNQVCNNCTFTNLTMSGQVNSTKIYADTCYLVNVTNFAGEMSYCVLVDSFSKKAGETVLGTNCNAYPINVSNIVIDFQNGAGKLALTNFSGYYDIQNFNNVGAVGYFSGNSMSITLNATVLKGALVFYGNGTKTGSTGRTMMTVAEYFQMNVDGTPGELLIINQLTPGSILDSYITSHLDTNTAGKYIYDLLTNVGVVDTNVDTSLLYSQSLSGIAGLIKSQTDKMNFTGTDIKATLDSEKVTVTSNEDKTGYALTSAYDPAKTASSQSSITTLQSTANSIENYSISISGVVGSIHLDTDTVETKLTTIEGKVDVVDTVVDSIKLDTKASGEIRGADNDDLKDLSDQLDTVASNTKRPVAGFDT